MQWLVDQTGIFRRCFSRDAVSSSKQNPIMGLSCLFQFADETACHQELPCCPLFLACLPAACHQLHIYWLLPGEHCQAGKVLHSAADLRSPAGESTIVGVTFLSLGKSDSGLGALQLASQSMTSASQSDFIPNWSRIKVGCSPAAGIPPSPVIMCQYSIR